MYIVGLGSNLGSRFATFEAALGLLDAREDCQVIARSLVYESAPMGPPQPDYLNAAVAVHSTLDPEAMLGALLEVEAQLGRVRKERWGPRVLDLDLLWGPQPHASAALTLPHPGLPQRWFALAPLLDVALDVALDLARELGADQPSLFARYAPELDALGGAPVRGMAFASASPARVQQDASGQVFALEVRGPLEEATAQLLIGLGQLRSSAQPCAHLAVHVVRAQREIASIVAETLQLVRSGLVIQHASVAADLAPVRLLGAMCPVDSTAQNARLQRVEVVAESPSEVRLRVECHLD